MKMNNIEDYINLISLLENALKFYANKDNYYSDIEFEFPLAVKDNGVQARFALDKIKEMTETNYDIDEDMVKRFSESISDKGDYNMLMKRIEDMKNNNEK